MLGGADNPNGELPSYITGADNPAAYICSGQLSPASHVMAWMVTPKGRSQTLKHRVPVADWRH